MFVTWWGSGGSHQLLSHLDGSIIHKLPYGMAGLVHADALRHSSHFTLLHLLQKQRKDMVWLF